MTATIIIVINIIDSTFRSFTEIFFLTNLLQLVVKDLHRNLLLLSYLLLYIALFAEISRQE